MSTDYPTDTEIHAYIDLEVDESRAETIKSMAARDENLAFRISQIRMLKEHLAIAFDDADDDSANEQFVEKASDIVYQKEHQTNVAPYAAAAMLVLGLLAGFFASQQYHKPAPENWVAQVVSYQDMYTKSTIGAIESTQHDLQATAEQLSNLLGSEFIIPDLSAMGMEFKRSQVLQSNNRPVVQLAYLDTATGEPVAVCITALAADSHKKNGAMGSDSSRTVNYVHWQSEFLEYVIIGRQLPEQLTELAKSTKAQQVS